MCACFLRQVKVRSCNSYSIKYHYYCYYYFVLEWYQPMIVVVYNGIRINMTTISLLSLLLFLLLLLLSSSFPFFNLNFLLIVLLLINIGYQPVIHCGVVRQAAEMKSITGCESLRTGQRAEVVFRFLYYSEYIVPGTTFLFREGRAKGIGKVVSLIA